MVWITVFSMHYAFWVTFAQGRCPLPCGDMCWDEKFPILLCIPLVIQKQSVPPRPWGDRGATHDIWRRSSCLFLYLLAPAWGAQRIDGERSSWSLPSEIAAEIKLVAGRREKKKKKRLLWSRKTSAQGRDHTLGTQSKVQRHQIGWWLWKQTISFVISVMESVTTQYWRHNTASHFQLHCTLSWLH